MAWETGPKLAFSRYSIEGQGSGVCGSIDITLEGNVISSSPGYIALYGNRLKDARMKPEEIKSLRKSKGLTQEQLATMMQVDSTTIYRWENGIVTPSLVKMAILRDILVKAGDGRTHPFVNHLLSRNQATDVLDFHGNYFNVNDGYEKLIGASRVELVSNNAWEFLRNLTKWIEDQAALDLSRLVQGKVACVRAENVENPATGTRLDHELHIIVQKDFSTIIVHEVKMTQSDQKWAVVTIDPKY